VISEELKRSIKSYKDFPKKGIVFRDFLPVLEKPYLFKELIKKMASNILWNKVDAIIAIDARGFLIGSALSQVLNKPLIVARKPGKLPGSIIAKTYELEYGTNNLSIQREALEKYQTFGVVDDLLATGGTVNCIQEILNSLQKEIKILSVVIELESLKGRQIFNFPVESQISYF
tara:strand:+ start:760 stop:1281 length:522 start_codon:yes stop_codon:yes gene_type:complete